MERLLRSLSWFILILGLFLLVTSVLADGEDLVLSVILLIVGCFGLYRTSVNTTVIESSLDPYREEVLIDQGKSQSFH